MFQAPVLRLVQKNGLHRNKKLCANNIDCSFLVWAMVKSERAGNRKYANRIEQIRKATGAALGAASLEAYRTLAGALGDLGLGDADVLEIVKGSRDLFTALRVLGIDPAENVRLDISSLGGGEGPERIAGLLGGDVPEDRQMPSEGRREYNKGKTHRGRKGDTVKLSRVFADISGIRRNPGNRRVIRDIIKKGEDPVLSRYVHSSGKRKDSYVVRHSKYVPEVKQRIRELLRTGPGKGGEARLSKLLARMRYFGKDRKRAIEAITTDGVLKRYVHQGGRSNSFLYSVAHEGKIIERVGELNRRKTRRGAGRRAGMAGAGDGISLSRAVSNYYPVIKLSQKYTGRHVMRRLCKMVRSSQPARKYLRTVEEGRRVVHYVPDVAGIRGIVDRLLPGLADELEAERGGGPSETLVTLTKAVGSWMAKKRYSVHQGRGTIRRVYAAIEADPEAGKYVIRGPEGSGQFVRKSDVEALLGYIENNIMPGVIAGIEAELGDEGAAPHQEGPAPVPVEDGGDSPRAPVGDYGGEVVPASGQPTNHDEVLDLAGIELRFGIPVADMQGYIHDPEYSKILGEPQDMPGGLGKGYTAGRILALKRELGSGL